MFNRKLFIFVFFLLFGKVENGPCDQWYLDFPTKFHCEEYNRLHPMTTKAISTTVKPAITSTTSTITTTTDDLISTTLPSFPTPIDYPTHYTTTTESMTSTTTSLFVPTLSEPAEEPIDYSTTLTTKTSTTFTTSTTTENVTNGATNKTPWFLSLWAIVLYM